MDKNGNEIDYGYMKSGGENWPTSIVYTLGNGNPGATRKLSFSWEPRSAAGASDIVHYLAGMKQSTTRLLTHIKTWVGSTEVRDYTLSYAQSVSTRRPLLAWVQACAYNSTGQTCFNPTTFSYQGQQPLGFTGVNGADIGLSDPTQPGSCRFSSYGDWVPADVNGDGRLDLVGHIKSKTQGTTDHVQYGKSGGTYGMDNPLGAGFLYLSPQFIDFNLDGRTDIPVWIYQSDSSTDLSFQYKLEGGSWQIKDTGIHFYPGTTANQEQIVDFNGDGRPDIIVNSCPRSGCEWEFWEASGNGVNTSYTEVGTLASPQGAAAAMQAFDYNADGRGDVLVRYRYAGYYKVLRSVVGQNGALSFTMLTTNVPVIEDPAGSGNYQPAVVADVNGDSLPDIVEVRNRDWTIYQNMGRADGHFATPIDTGIGGPYIQDGQWSLAGFVRTMRDPDGRTDLLVPTNYTYIAPTLVRNKNSNNPCLFPARSDDLPSPYDGYNWKLLRATGAGSGLNFVSLGQVAQNLRLGMVSVFDYDADGLSDIAGAIAKPINVMNNAAIIHLEHHNGAVPDLMASSDNGFGVQDSFIYKPISDPSVYAY